MYCQRHISSNTMKKNSNTVSQKENDNSPATKFNLMEDWNLTDREFKISVMKKIQQITKQVKKCRKAFQ